MSNEYDIMCIIWQSAGNDNTNCRIESTSDTCTCLFTTQNNILNFWREDNDANCTYEGDNNVLLQQTANWILKCVHQVRDTPAGSLSWIQVEFTSTI